MICILIKKIIYKKSKYFFRNISNHKSFKISVLPSEKHNEAIRFVREYFSDDPLMTSLGVTKNDESLELLDCLVLEDLKAGLSLQALSTFDNRMVGISVNGGQDEIGFSSDILRKCAALCESDAARNLFLAWSELASIKIPQLTMGQSNKVFIISIVAVSADHREQGIANELIKQSLCMGKCNNFNLAKIECTSQFSAQLAASWGFKCIWQKPLSGSPKKRE